MNELESLGIIELDDSRVKVRQEDGTLARISEMLAGAGITQAQVNQTVATAIASLVGTAPEALDTLGELSASFNNDATAYATLLALIQAKSPLLSFPSSATSTNLLSGTTLRAIEPAGILALSESSDRLTHGGRRIQRRFHQLSKINRNKSRRKKPSCSPAALGQGCTFWIPRTTL